MDDKELIALGKKYITLGVFLGFVLGAGFMCLLILIWGRWHG